MQALHRSICASHQLHMGVCRRVKVGVNGCDIWHPPVKINSAYYCKMLLTQQLPQFMPEISNEVFIFQQNSTLPYARQSAFCIDQCIILNRLNTTDLFHRNSTSSFSGSTITVTNTCTCNLKHSLILSHIKISSQGKWMAPWKNRLSSTTMNLIKITHKASDVAEYIELFCSSTRDRHAWSINVILWTTADICVVVHDDLG